MSAANPSVSSQFTLSEAPNPVWSFGKKTNTTPAGREWMQGVDSVGWRTTDVATEDPRSVWLSLCALGLTELKLAR